MKKTIIIGILLIIGGCSREEYLNQYQVDSPISFNSALTTNAPTGSYKDGLFIDTIKTSKSTIYKKQIEIQNTQSIEKIEVYRGSNLMYSINVVPTSKVYNLSWNVDSSGLNNYQIMVTQKNGQTKIIDCQIYSFINWPPVVNLIYDQQNKRFDLSSSFDLDQRFGGNIISYKIYVNGNQRTNDNNVFFYTTIDNGFFGSNKSYNIKVISVDNDGTSSLIEKVYTI